MRSNNSVADGRLVVDRNQAEGPHPHPSHKGAIVPYKTVNQVLLEDGDVVYECDFPGAEDCTYIADNVKSVASHQHMHGEDAGEPLYPVETLKAIIRAAKIAQRDGGHRRYAERAAEALAAQGVKRRDGQPFNASDVSRLNREYRDRYPVRILGRPPVPRNHTDVPTPPKLPLRDDAIESKFRTIADALDVVAVSLRAISKEVRNLEADVTDRRTRDRAENAIDAEIMDKAKRWDEFQALMNGKSK
jgi:hypothetical protein